MKTYLFAIALSIFTVYSSAFAGSTGVRELDRLKSIYEQQIQRLHTKNMTDRVHVPQDHIKALRKLELEYQQLGDLKNLLAVRNERKRFTISPGADDMTPVSSPEKLRELQLEYIKNYRKITRSLKNQIKSTRDQYIARLKILQKSLTKKGNIDDALIVMNEIEKTKRAGKTNSVSSILSTNTDNPPPAAHVETSDKISLEDIENYFHGKIERWNSYNNEITISYDFSDSEQAKDWSGGTLDNIESTLVCHQSLVWLRIQFDMIKRVESGIKLEDPSRKAYIKIGKRLTIQLKEDPTVEGCAFQTSDSFPIIKVSKIRESYGRPYQSSVTLNDRQLSWSINNGVNHHGTLTAPINYPTFVGVGGSDSDASYSMVSVNGILSRKQIARIKEHLDK
jgi:hypothetical protein